MLALKHKPNYYSTIIDKIYNLLFTNNEIFNMISAFKINYKLRNNFASKRQRQFETSPETKARSINFASTADNGCYRPTIGQGWL